LIDLIDKSGKIGVDIDFYWKLIWFCWFRNW